MAKKIWKSGTFIYPIPAVMVSCGTFENSNIITIAWTGILNTNPAKVYISVRPERYSYKLIKENMEFVINLTTKDLAYQTDWCGVRSGSKFDKFKEMNLTKEKANFIATPMIKESPVSIECKVIEIKDFESHHMFIADVLAINADEKYFDENGAFDIGKCDLIAYANGSYYSLGKKIGKFGYSVESKKKNSNVNESNNSLYENKKDINKNKIKISKNKNSKIKNSKDGNSKLKNSKNKNSKIKNSKDRNSKLKNSKNSKDRNSKLKNSKNKNSKIKNSKDRNRKLKDSKNKNSKIKNIKNRNGKIKNTN